MKRFLKNVLFIAVFAFIAIFVTNSVYKKIGYGYFKKAISRPGITFFTRDNKVRYSNMNSYKIENKDYNNSTFYKKIKVSPNTPYKITCMIKTEGVEILDNSYENSGAKINLLDSTEQSESVVGTNDWKKVTLMFNSKQNEELRVGFMLGGNSEFGNVKGTAWFSDLKLEEGTFENSGNWNFGCFIFRNTDVRVAGKRYKYSMTEKDVEQVENCMNRFKESIPEICDNQMKVSYKVIDVDTPINKLSYDESKGYYVDPIDIKDTIDDYLKENNFDHIFVCVRLNDEKSSVPIKNWIGLGSMQYKNIGFSNIRMPTSSTSYEYIYNDKINKFPEEVFIHEFIHSLEKMALECGYDIPALHDNEKYGYKEDELTGLYNWYKDYMTSNIGDDKLGLKEQIYKMKPISEVNFYNYKMLDEFEDVKNIAERLQLVLKTINNEINS